MKNYLQIICIVFVLVSCSNGLELNSPINKHLDREIKSRILLLTKTSELPGDQNKDLRLDVSKIDREINEMASKINLFDESIQIAEKANEYFTDLAIKLNLDKEAFIDLREVKDKPDLIVSIKMNELKVLDEIILDKNIPSSENLQK